ncbi:MAG: hypothetical protein ABIF40_04380 [archaeon]
MKRWLASIPLALSLTFAAPAFGSDLEKLRVRLELGKYTQDDVKNAKEILYGVLEENGQLDLSYHCIRYLVKEGDDVEVSVRNYVHDLKYVDKNSDWLEKGSDDMVVIYDGPLAIKYKFDEPGKIFQRVLPMGEEANTRAMHDILDKTMPDSSYTEKNMDLDQWNQDVEDLIKDYEQALVIDWYFYLKTN